MLLIVTRAAHGLLRIPPSRSRSVSSLTSFCLISIRSDGGDSEILVTLIAIGKGGWGPHPILSRSRSLRHGSRRPNASLSSRHGRRLRHAESGSDNYSTSRVQTSSISINIGHTPAPGPADRGHAHSGTAPVARRRRATESRRIRSSSRVRSRLLHLQPHARARPRCPLAVVVDDAGSGQRSSCPRSCPFVKPKGFSGI